MHGAVLQKPEVLSQGTLKDGSAVFTVCQLDGSWVDVLYDHYLKVRTDLPAKDKMCLRERNRASFEDHFKKGGIVVGAFVEDRMVAQAALFEPVGDVVPQCYPSVLKGSDLNSYAFFQTTMIDQEYRGQGIVQAMLQARLAFAFEHKREHAIAQVDIRNVASLKVLVAEGFSAFSMDPHPNGDSYIIALHKDVRSGRLARGFNRKIKPKPEIERYGQDASDAGMLQKRFNEGYRGVALTPSGRLVFSAKPRPFRY